MELGQRWRAARSRHRAARDPHLDQSLAVLVAHGYSDLETPYFQTHLILDQVAEQARVMRRTYPGGHMFYDRDNSRAAIRADAEQFYRALTKP